VQGAGGKLQHLFVFGGKQTQKGQG
jgi:hypothetical protein